MSTSGQKQRREVHYRGRVQGVGFRYATRRIASQFAVTGSVRNLPDGRVLVLAEGDPEELDRFLQAVRSLMRQYIREATETVAPATGRFDHFDIEF